MTLNPGALPGFQSFGLSTQPPPSLVGTQTHISGWVLEVGFDLCSEISPFAFCTPVAVLSSGFLNCTLVPVQERASMSAETFPPSQLLPRYPGSVWIPLSLSLFFSLCILPYPFMWGLACLFGRQISASIQ